MEVREGRHSPLVRHVVLLVAFLLLVTAGVLTVLLPALEEEPAEGAEVTGQDSPEAPPD